MPVSPYSKGVKYLHKCRKEGNLNIKNNANLVIQYDNGAVQYCSSQACHAGLAYGMDHSVRASGAKHSQWVISGIQHPSRMSGKEEIKKDEKEFYLQWLMNDSFFAPIFQTKEPSWCIENDVIVCRTDVPSNQLAGGLQATRRLWEFTHIPIMFKKFCEEGMNPELAYWLAHFCKINESGVIVSGCGDAHHNIAAAMFSKEDLLRWLSKETVEDSLNPIYRKSENYRGIFKMFQKGEASPSNRCWQIYVKNFELETKSERKVINPFVKAKQTSDRCKTYPMKDLVEQMTSKLAPKILKEVGYAKGNDS